MALCRILGSGTTMQMLPASQDPWYLYFAPTAVGHSLIVYDDGHVEEGIGFTIWDTKRPGVNTWIQGGTMFLVENPSWLASVLEEAGYTLEVFPNPPPQPT